MRGVHFLVLVIITCLQGSSPHARGPPMSLLGARSGLGIIPACAGSTSVHIFGFRAVEDHPRMRGVHYWW